MIGIPILIATWDTLRVKREATNAELLAQDATALCSQGDHERALSRCAEVGGDLGRCVGEILAARRSGQEVPTALLDTFARRLTWPRSAGLFALWVAVFAPWAAFDLCMWVSRTGALPLTTTGIGAVTLGVLLMLGANTRSARVRVRKALDQIVEATGTRPTR